MCSLVDLHSRIVLSIILSMQDVTFHEGNITSTKYMDSFPFPYYVVLKNIEALPRTLADLLRQVSFSVIFAVLPVFSLFQVFSSLVLSFFCSGSKLCSTRGIKYGLGMCNACHSPDLFVTGGVEKVRISKDEI